MAAYYNENDPQKVAWLRELIRRGLIADGVVDDRPIEVVEPADLAGHEQCHFFAGIGVWSYALRNAGWTDDARVWTGSCPCPSFSQSGKGLGFDDPRHLWPAWFRLIAECRPHVCLGEQVTSKAGLAWLDLVSADLEGAGYAVGAADLCAAGVGAPHIRQRTYWVSESEGERRSPRRNSGSLPLAETRPERPSEQLAGCGTTGRLSDATSERRGEEGREHSGRSAQRLGVGSEPRGIRHTEGEGLQREWSESGAALRDEHWRLARLSGDPWSGCAWLPYIDGKERPVEPGTFPLAHGAPARVVRLRGYGDAIVAQVAQAFIEAYLDVRGAA